jgi:hypothetical protein
MKSIFDARIVSVVIMEYVLADEGARVFAIDDVAGAR